MSRLQSMHAPIDRVAARVIRPGIHYEKRIPEGARHWKEPPQTALFKRQKYNPTCIDLTGVTFGLFTVVGYLGRIGAKASGGRRLAMWLVRCACGDYEARTSKAIKNTANADDRCFVCRGTEYWRSGTSDPQEWFRRKAEARK